MSLGSIAVVLLCCLAASLLLLRIASLILIKFAKPPQSLSTSTMCFRSGLKLGETSHPVRYCSEALFNRRLRLLPWEAVGTFTVGDTNFEFDGVTRDGKKLHFDFDKLDSRVQYVDRNFLRDGGLSWFAVEFDDVRYYFTSEGALPDFETPLTTTGVYEAVSDVYVNS